MADPTTLAVLDRAAFATYSAAARAEWPAFPVTEQAFMAYVFERAAGSLLPPLAQAPDLLLACACVAGDPLAIAAFRRRQALNITSVLARRGASALCDDVQQILFERLLVGSAKRGPRLADYSGTGRLDAWIGSAAVNVWLVLQRTAKRRREQPASDAIKALVAPDDLEREVLRQRYKQQLEEAIASAVNQLPERERTLLRLHLGERVSIDTLGVMYGVNRATAARWLVAARRALVEGARASIRNGLRVTPQEYESLGVALQSELEVSLLQHL